MNCKIVEPENLYTDFLCRHKSQHGGGNIPHFSGVQFQKGYGIGNVLGNLFRNIIPIARTAFKVAQPVLKKNQALSDITQLRTKKINKNERKRKRKKPVYSKAKIIKRYILD